MLVKDFLMYTLYIVLAMCALYVIYTIFSKISKRPFMLMFYCAYAIAIEYLAYMLSVNIDLPMEQLPLTTKAVLVIVGISTFFYSISFLDDY